MWEHTLKLDSIFLFEGLRKGNEIRRVERKTIWMRRIGDDLLRLANLSVVRSRPPSFNGMCDNNHGASVVLWPF